MKKIIAGVGLAGMLLPVWSFAAYFKAGNGVFLGPDDLVTQNAYLAGGTVNASSQVSGDLMAAGGTVIVSSKVAGDVAAAGGTVVLTGVAAQDVRVAGGNVTVGGKFSGELVGLAGQLTVTPDTVVAGDTYMAGGTVIFGGTENGKLTLAAKEVRIDGMVADDVVVMRAEKVTLGSHAVLKKNFEYTAQAPVVIESGAQVIGKSIFHETPAPAPVRRAFPAFAAGIFTIWLVVKFAATLAAAYLLWYLRKGDAKAIIAAARGHFWRALFWGFAFLILLPAAAFISFLTVIGSIPAIAALLVYGAVLILTGPVMVLYVASCLVKDMAAARWYHLALGALLLSVVAFAPFIGWIACFIVYLVSLGGLVEIVGSKFKS